MGDHDHSDCSISSIDSKKIGVVVARIAVVIAIVMIQKGTRSGARFPRKKGLLVFMVFCLGVAPFVLFIVFCCYLCYFVFFLFFAS